MAESTENQDMAPRSENNASSPPEKNAPQSEKNEAPINSGVKKQKFPDWQPLGSVRDSFFEQMKQDNRL